MRFTQIGSVLCALLLSCTFANAGQVALPQTIKGGGTGASTWDVRNSCSFAGGTNAMCIGDGSLNGHNDAFDDFGGIVVDGVAVQAPGGLVTVNGQFVTTAAQTLSGLTVTLEYYFDPVTANWRTLATFVNPTGADISSVIHYGGNLGSDNNTVIRASSSGDLVFKAADRWAISTDQLTDPIGDPANTIVFYGPGSPRVPITSVVTAHGVGPTFDDVDVSYNITVPAGQTRSLLFFVQFNTSGAEAIKAVGTFDSNTALLNAGLLDGLTQTTLSQILNWDFSALSFGSVQSFVWNDVNGNGIQDVGEPGISGVTLRLLSPDETFIRAAVTDSTGHIVINVAVGNYQLELVRANGFKLSPKDQGTDDAVDSDFTPSTGIVSITVAASATSNQDAGLISVAATAFGADATTLYRVNSASGITTVVATTGGRNITGLAVDPTSGTLFAITGSTGTNPNTLFTVDKTTGVLTMVAALSGFTPFGDISFDSTGQLFGFDTGTGAGTQDVYKIDKATAAATLVADSTLTGTKGEGLAFRADGTLFLAPFGNDGSLLTVNPTTGLTTVVAQLSGAPGPLNNDSVSAMAFGPDGYLYATTNNGGAESFLVVIDPVTGKITSRGQLPNGFEALCFDVGANAPATISGKVWTETDANGILDSGESLTSGVTVNLLLSGEKVASVVSDSHGYGFSVAAGTYVVEFKVPAGDFFTKQDQGTDDTVDSDADRTTGRTAAIALTASQIKADISAGLVAGATIGNRVFSDLNANGIQDVSDGTGGVSNVIVQLLNEVGTVVAATTSDSNGNYGFSPLDPLVKYVVQFTPPAGMAITLKDQGSDDALDSDADQVTGKTALITLTPGQINNTIDVGLVTPVFPTITSPASASNTAPIVGETVTFSVTATDPNGNPLTVTWDFGDGTTGTGATVTHVYTTTGVFVATATVSNGTVGGTSTSSQTVIVGALPLVVTKASVKLSITKPGTDTIGISGVMPIQTGIVIASQSVTVNFGGVIKTFNLDAKGGAKSGKDSIKIGIKGANAQNAKFSVKLNGDFKAALAKEGFNNGNNTNKPVLVNISIAVGTKLFATTTQMFYTSKLASGGTAK